MHKFSLLPKIDSPEDIKKLDTHVHWEGWMGEIFVNHGITSVLAQADISKMEKAHALGSRLRSR